MLLLAASLAPAGYGQFQLFVVNGSAEQPAEAVYNLGAVYPNQAASAHFRLRNTSSAAATVTVLSVAGAGFTLNGPALPVALNPQAAVDFTVTFLAPDAGSYSAPLLSDGVSLLLLATVLPRLTYEVDTGAGLQPLGTAPVDFGSVELGSNMVRHFVAVNQMTVVLAVPAIAVAGGDFALSGVAPSGTVLQPGQSAAFDVRFSPTVAGARSGSLVIGGQTYALVGTGAQLTYEVDAGAGLQPLGARPVDFGSVQLGFTVARHFAVVNQSAIVLTAPFITVPPGDFALSGAAPGGLALQPGQSADFYVQFTPTATGARTGSLVIGGQTYALVGTGLQLTYQVDAGAGLQPLGAGPVDFGSALLGVTVARHFAVVNQTTVVLTAPPIAVPPGDFALNGTAAGGLALQPGQSADFYVQFTPTATGVRTGSLVIGNRTYALVGTGLQLTYQVDAGAGLQPLGTGPVDFGSAQLGFTVARHFAVANQTAVVLAAPPIAVSAGDFALSGASPGGLALQPGQSADFYVQFTPTATGARSGSLVIGNRTYALVGTGLQLTYEVDAGAGLQPLGTGPVDFGSVELGFNGARHFAVANQTTAALTAPPIAVSASDFALSGATPGGLALQPGQSADFYVQFTPTATGARTGSLVVGNTTYALIGTGIQPPLPKPRLSISLPQTLSAQQGTVTVTLDAASRTSGSGTVTLDFQPASGLPNDPTIMFLLGGRTALISVVPGDTQVHFGPQLMAYFQTGTTAGTLIFTVQLGGVTDQQTIAILPASVGIVSVQGVRSAAGVQVQVTGFDNTHTAGLLTFTFFDAAGSTVAPGAIRADATASFASYFQNSGLGGSFLLTAIFPVTGNPSQVGAFQVQIANSVGTAQTARTVF